MKANPITKFFACRRKDYKRQIEETNKKKVEKRKKKKKKTLTLSFFFLKKKNTLFSWLSHQLVLAIDLVCSQIFISGSFFVFSSFAYFVFFMVCCWAFRFFFWRGVCSLLLGFYSSFWLNFSLVVHLYSLHFFVCSLNFWFL